MTERGSRLDDSRTVTRRDLRKPMQFGHGVELLPLSVSITGAKLERFLGEGLESIYGDPDRRVLKVSGRALDRDTGAPVELRQDYEFLESFEKDHFLHAVRDLLHRMVCHEVDKSLLHHGKRVFDPHGNGL